MRKSSQRVFDQCPSDGGLQIVRNCHLIRAVPLLVFVEQEVLAGWRRVAVVA